MLNCSKKQVLHQQGNFKEKSPKKRAQATEFIHLIITPCLSVTNETVHPQVREVAVPSSSFLVEKLAHTRLEYVGNAGRVCMAGSEAGGQVINGGCCDGRWGTSGNGVDGAGVSSCAR